MGLPHEVLGVSPIADLASIKRAFRTLAKEQHPDRNRDPRANARFRELVSAYRTLVHECAERARAPRPASVPPTWAAPPPARAAASATFADDVSWADSPSAVHGAYPNKLARFVVLGTLGFVALLWVSAFLSQL